MQFNGLSNESIEFLRNHAVHGNRWICIGDVAVIDKGAAYAIIITKQEEVYEEEMPMCEEAESLVRLSCPGSSPVVGP